MKRILLCTDLDRTLIPNGLQPESSGARSFFKKLVAAPYITLVYVSGRSFKLLSQAIADYDLPDPDFMVGDVGTVIYRKPAGSWQLCQQWQEMLARAWQKATTAELSTRLTGLAGLKLQETAKQSPFKLSFYTDPDVDQIILAEKIRSRLAGCPTRIRLVFSVDEVKRIGLLDLLPAAASKLHAINFLVRETGISPDRTFYAGDSGNDLEVLTSPLKAILVANATDKVRTVARKTAPPDTLYFAKGNFMGMNGNYAAGLLEGMVHYLPELAPLLPVMRQPPKNTLAFGEK